MAIPYVERVLQLLHNSKLSWFVPESCIKLNLINLCSSVVSGKKPHQTVGIISSAKNDVKSNLMGSEY